jgi:hypothetical protein
VAANRADGGRFQLTQPFGSYTGTAWYHLQAIVNMGDKNRKWGENDPVDGAYILNINSGFLGTSGYAGGVQLYALSLRMMQERASYGAALWEQTGYAPHWGQDPTRVFMQSDAAAWRQVSADTKAKMLGAIMKTHYEYLERFSAADFRAAKRTEEFEAINSNGNQAGFLSRLRAILLFMNSTDPTSTLKDDIARKADAKFPGFGFAASAKGAAGFQVSVGLSGKAKVLNPKTNQLEDTYPAQRTFAAGQPIRLKGFWHGDGSTRLQYARGWYQINGVTQKTFAAGDYDLMNTGDGIVFSIAQPGTYVVNVLIESTEGVIAGTREELVITPP